MKPVRHSTPVPIKKARIEIIPLIDIMFFLLASFMLVSLSMINMKGVDVNLPTAKAAEPNEKPDLLIVGVDALDDIYFGQDKVAKNDVPAKFKQIYEQNKDQKIFIRTVPKATYETFLYVFDQCRKSGLEKVSLQTKIAETLQAPPPSMGPLPAAAPAAPAGEPAAASPAAPGNAPAAPAGEPAASTGEPATASPAAPSNAPEATAAPAGPAAPASPAAQENPPAAPAPAAQPSPSQ
jgi:biopolymer transport protein ExbD